MVGVAGKSQGCNTCRKRKIKCDQERPSCGQCTKSERQCTGYQRNRHFKNLSALDHDTLIVRKQPLNPITKPSVIAYDQGEVQLKKEPSKTVPTSLVQLFEYFLTDFIPQGEKAKQDSPVHWLQTIQNPSNLHSGNNASLPLAITALSLARLGRKHQDVELQNEGISVYGQALEGFQEILSSDDLVFEEQTLASCMTLLVFELLETHDSNLQGWRSHIQGLSQLFQLRGPSLHISDSSHRLFLGFRRSGIVYALAIRRSTYLGDEEWLTIPWQKVPKSDFHHLLDIMARMPNLIEQTELAISKHLTSTTTEMDFLRERYCATERELRTWYSKLVASSTTPLLFEMSSKMIATPTLSNLHPLTDSSLSFPSFELARTHLFYWAALLLIYINLTSSFPPSTSSYQYPQVQGQLRSEMHTTAMLIARSIPYLLSPETQTMGPQNVPFPLRSAMHVFAELGEDREERWCRDVFEEMDKRGFRFGKILANVKWEDIPSFLGRRS